MTARDDLEMHRLSAALGTIDEQFALSDVQREALTKAALALQRAFIDRKFAVVEEWYTKLDQPLTEDERQHLISLGIEPDVHSKESPGT